MRVTLIGTADFCGKPWAPPRVNDGIPGTEEAFIHMARRLAARGHDVNVYVHTGDLAGTYDGAVWRDISTLPARLETDVAVVLDISRIANMETDGLIYYWMQSDGADLSGPEFRRVHKFMPLSMQSRQRFPAFPDQRFFLSRNGIEVSQFEREVERHPRKVVYGSDYDRGLIWLLAAWPKVRAAHPDAELHIFYGWQIFDRKIELFGESNPELGRQWAAYKAQLERGMAHPGVVHLGRVGHEEVARQFLSAAVWAYPCTFPETSCITAMKAQVAGAIPVVYATAALGETVRWGLKAPAFQEAWPMEEKRRVHDAWTQALINLLGDADGQEKLRTAMVAETRAFFNWDRVAEEWLAEFAAETAKPRA